MNTIVDFNWKAVESYQLSKRSASMQSVSRIRLLRPAATARHFVPLRTFSGARPLRLKEDKEQSPKEIEKQKQENLKNNEKNRELASSSEEVVDAEQEKVKDHDQHMDKLQKQTAQKSEEKHPEGKA